MDSDISDNIEKVTSRVNLAAVNVGRNPDSVRILAVSKTKPIENIRDIYNKGINAFGENYVSEGVEKISLLRDLAIEWHFIGPIQSNKLRLIAENFLWVQSLTKKNHALKLNKFRPVEMPGVNVCIQINPNNEESKSGITFEQLDNLVKVITEQPNLNFRGIMAIPDESTLETTFSRLHETYKELQSRYDSVDTLSIGMSGDIELAIKYGSTLVRVGTALFGAREKR